MANFQSGYIRYNELHTSLQKRIPYLTLTDFITTDNTGWETTSEGLYSITFDMSQYPTLSSYFDSRYDYIDLKMFDSTDVDENIIFSYKIEGLNLTIIVDEISNYKVIIDVYRVVEVKDK